MGLRARLAMLVCCAVTSACVPASTPPPPADAQRPTAPDVVLASPRGGALPRATHADAQGGTGIDAAAAPPHTAEVTAPTQRSRVRTIAPGARSGLVEFAARLPDDALTWVGPLAGNGGRDVLVHIPAGAAAKREVQLVYHFHGTHSETVAEQRPGMKKSSWVGWDRAWQAVEAVTELQGKGDHAVALVYPLSAGKRPEPGHVGWFNKEYDRMWMRSHPPASTDDFDALHAEVVAVLGDAFGVAPGRVRPEVIAEGHSAGGIALRNIAQSGTRHVGEYIFLDASFRGWADGCHRAVQARASATEPAALVTLVVTEGGIADPFGRSDPWCRTGDADVAAWSRHRAECEGGAKRARGADKSCAALHEAALGWPEQKGWCAAMADDLRSLPGAYLLRTRIPHGKQPRHFVGGLELPASRLDARRR